MWLNALIVFVAMTVVDFFYGRYTIAAAERKAISASIWGTGIIFANSVVVIEYVNNHWLILAAAVGSALGTYISIKTKKD
jgi:hypothetical protein